MENNKINFSKSSPPKPPVQFPTIAMAQMIQQYFNLVAQQTNRPIIPSTSPNSLNPMLQCNMFFPFSPLQLQQPPLLSPSFTCGSTSAGLPSPPQPISSHSIENILSGPQKLLAQITPRPSLQNNNNTNYLMNLLTPPTVNNITPQQQPRRGPVYRAHVTRESAKPLKEWMESHITDPYPTPQEIEELAQITGFSVKQVRDWFTNNRRRREQSLINKNQPVPWRKRDSPKNCPAPY